MEFSLGAIGMEDDLYATFRELIQLPHGIILVTGPTGSGKTTTLYSSLLEIRDDETKIITTEDPVEYQLEGINQIQVHAEDRADVRPFAAEHLASRPGHHSDRRNPRPGNGRERHPGRATGHLVFSTLHTNDAAGAFTRLVDMGVEPFLVSSTVEAVMAQRLVRTLCPHCKQPYTPDAGRTAPPISPIDEVQAAASRCIAPWAAGSAARWASAAAWASSSCW